MSAVLSNHRSKQTGPPLSDKCNMAHKSNCSSDLGTFGSRVNHTGCFTNQLLPIGARLDSWSLKYTPGRKQLDAQVPCYSISTEQCWSRGRGIAARGTRRWRPGTGRWEMYGNGIRRPVEVDARQGGQGTGVWPAQARCVGR